MRSDAVESDYGHQPRRYSRSLATRIAAIAAGLLLLYLLVAYLTLPSFWRFYAHRHPALANLPGITTTGDHHPGDPINIALIASPDDLSQVMREAGWHPADPLGLRSDLRIAADTVLKRPYTDAPVSNLYLWGRKEDLAFEQPVGDNPRERHHIRFWKSVETDAASRPLWAGAATFDRRVGLSHTTGQITHHIAPDIDTERDHVADSLKQTGQLTAAELIPNFHQPGTGHNGGGDPWHTDGSLFVGAVGR